MLCLGLAVFPDSAVCWAHTSADFSPEGASAPGPHLLGGVRRERMAVA